MCWALSSADPWSSSLISDELRLSDSSCYTHDQPLALGVLRSLGSLLDGEGLVFDKLSISDSSSPTLAPCTVYVADALVQTTHPNVRIAGVARPIMVSPLFSFFLFLFL